MLLLFGLRPIWNETQVGRHCAQIVVMWGDYNAHYES